MSKKKKGSRASEKHIQTNQKSKSEMSKKGPSFLQKGEINNPPDWSTYEVIESAFEKNKCKA